MNYQVCADYKSLTLKIIPLSESSMIMEYECPRFPSFIASVVDLSLRVAR